MPRSLCRSCHSRAAAPRLWPRRRSRWTRPRPRRLSLAAPVLSLARVLSSLASVLSPTFMPGETDSLSDSPEAAVSLLLGARGAASPKPPRRTLRRVVSSCTPMQQPSTLGTSTTSHEQPVLLDRVVRDRREAREQQLEDHQVGGERLAVERRRKLRRPGSREAQLGRLEGHPLRPAWRGPRCGLRIRVRARRRVWLRVWFRARLLGGGKGVRGQWMGVKGSGHRCPWTCRPAH